MRYSKPTSRSILATSLATILAISPSSTSGQPTAESERVCVTADALNAKIDAEAALRCRLAVERADSLPQCLAAERAATAAANAAGGALAECRDNDAKRIALAVELGHTQAERDRRLPKWLVAVIATAAALLGAAGGYTVAKVVK